MSGVKTPSIKLGDLNVKTSSGKASSVKGNVIDNVFKGKPVKTVFDDNVILDHAPTVGESAAAGEIITGGSTRIRSVSKMDVHNYWSKLTEIKPDSTDGPASSLSMAPKRSTPTRLETMFEVGKMATREMRVKRDATKYWGKLGNLETDPVKFTGGDLTGLKPNTKSNMLGMELDKGVFDYSRIYPNTAEPSMFKGAMLEGYLKNSRTRLGDVLSRQELIYETRIKPASVKPARTTLNSEAIFRIHSPRVLPSTGALYTIPKNTPKALSFDMQTVILPPAVKSSTKTFDVLTPKVSTSTRIKPNQTIDYGFARMTGLTTGSMVAQRALSRPRYFNVLGGSGRGSSRRNKFEARHDWINAGIFDVDMDFGLAPKKRKRRGRKQ
jgi:hypothetical protein